LDLAKEKQITEEISNKLLLVPEDKGQTVWYMAAKAGKLELLYELCA